MRRILVIVIVLNAFISTVIEQNTAASREELAGFLVKYCGYRDPNPTWQQEADQLADFLRRAIRDPGQGNDYSARTAALEIFYDNSIAVFEDMPDVRRFAQWRYMCCIALALAADQERYGAFLGDALRCLDGFRDEFFYKQYLMVELFNIYISSGFDGSISERTIEKLLEESADLRDKIEDKLFIADYIKLLGGLGK